MFPNGTLLISDLNEVLDSGQYACQAKSSSSSPVQGNAGADHFALQHVQVSIKVPPVVEPLAFAKSLHRGQRYNIMCTVTRGDLPVSIRWFKDGRLIEPMAAPIRGNNFALEHSHQRHGLHDLAGAGDAMPFLAAGPPPVVDQVVDSTGGDAGLAIKQLDPYSSTLTFASLQSYHRGE